MPEKGGIFIISLDFELYWGLHDVVTLPTYTENLYGVHEIIPKLLRLFEQYEIHVTWATVGFLFFDNMTTLEMNLPTTLPQYKNKMLSPFAKIKYFHSINSKLLFAPTIIEQICKIPYQEIATHTFSHYYCLEIEQNAESFRCDLIQAIVTAQKFGIRINSIVFPRNQVNVEYLSICRELGIRAYRGTPKHQIYRPRLQKKQNLLIRFFRLLDAYMPLLSYHTYKLATVQDQNIVNIPASIFLRPYEPRLRYLEFLRLKRITSSMTHAAKHGEMFHLWWHPHNFGIYQKENIQFLEKILQHYKYLEKKYRMRTMNMNEVTDYLNR